MVTISHDSQRGAPDTTDVDEGTGRRIFPWGWQSVGAWLLAFVVFSAPLVALGLLVTHVADGSAVMETEVGASEWVERQRTDTRNEVATWGSFISDTIPKTIAIVALAAGFVIVWRRWHDAVFLVATMLLEVSVFGFVARAVGRARPPIEQLDGAPTDSFPSGHAAAAVAFYGALAVITFWHTRSRPVRTVAVAMAVAAALTVAVSRFYLGMHHISDIVAGMALGAASLVVVYGIVHRGVERVPAHAPPHTRRLEMHAP